MSCLHQIFYLYFVSHDLGWEELLGWTKAFEVGEVALGGLVSNHCKEMHLYAPVFAGAGAQCSSDILAVMETANIATTMDIPTTVATD